MRRSWLLLSLEGMTSVPIRRSTEYARYLLTCQTCRWSVPVLGFGSMTEVEERPAPDRLELIRAFVNTRDIELQTEALTSPRRCRAGSRSTTCSAAGERVTAADWRRRSRCARRSAPCSSRTPRTSRLPPTRSACSTRRAPSMGLPRASMTAARSAIVTPAARCPALARHAARGHARGDRPRPLDPPEGLPRGVVSLGVLRHEPEPLVALVPHGRVRQPQQEPRVLRAAARAGRAAPR